MNQQFFHYVFVAIFVIFTIIRLYFHRKAFKEMGKAEFKEGKMNNAIRLFLGVPFILILFYYMYDPSILAFAQFELPEFVQWIGMIFGIISLPLSLWLQIHLGANFSTTLHIREKHTLTNTGPYKYVRHPMYSVIFIHLLALLLLTKNWFIGLSLVVFIVIVITRINNEEKAMVEKFGDNYRNYVKTTPRFFPKLF